MQKLPVGISDFKELRIGNYYFVDKSFFIKDVINDGAKVVLIPRPRRFGKTLNMTMLKYFFDIKNKDENRNLFTGLAIADEPVFSDNFGKYPVIFISLKDIKQTSFEDAIDLVKSTVARIYKQANYLVERLPEVDIHYFAEIVNKTANTTDYQDALLNLCDFYYTYHSIKPIILIDEYDTPIHAAWQYGYYEEMIAFMRTFLGAALKDNIHLHKGILTGILRVARESIFSELNNLGVYTLLSQRYSDKFGFTVTDVEELLAATNHSDKYSDIQNWYNGYLFAGKVIYNPWSLLNYLSNIADGFKTYWANTSSNEILRDLIRKSPDKVRNNLFCLMKNETIESTVNENIVLRDLRGDDVSVFSFLLFSGYLKASYLQTIENEMYYTLSIPNTEVRLIFKNTVQSWFNESYENRKLQQMLSALVKTDIPVFERILSEMVVTTLSYFTTSGKDVEKVYQAFLLGMLINLPVGYEVTSEKEAGYGRYDIAILPPETNNTAIVMELKTLDDFNNETKDQALDNALAQIEKKQYVTQIQTRGYSNIAKLAVTFDGKRVWVKQGK